APERRGYTGSGGRAPEHRLEVLPCWRGARAAFPQAARERNGAKIARESVPPHFSGKNADGAPFRPVFLLPPLGADALGHLPRRRHHAHGPAPERVHHDVEELVLREVPGPPPVPRADGLAQVRVRLGPDEDVARLEAGVLERAHPLVHGVEDGVAVGRGFEDEHGCGGRRCGALNSPLRQWSRRCSTPPAPSAPTTASPSSRAGGGPTARRAPSSSSSTASPNTAGATPTPPPTSSSTTSPCWRTTSGGTGSRRGRGRTWTPSASTWTTSTGRWRGRVRRPAASRSS